MKIYRKQTIDLQPSWSKINKCQWCGVDDNVSSHSIDDYSPEMGCHYVVVNLCLGCWQMHDTQMANALSEYLEGNI